MTRVSVVICAGEEVPDALAALRLQTHPDFEVIVRATSEERNPNQARNDGAAAAAGEIVAFLDPGTLPEPDWLTHLVAAYADPAVGGTKAGTSFRRSVLAALGGFDANVTDAAELCARVVAAGHELRAVPEAVVHGAQTSGDPYEAGRSAAYAAVRSAGSTTAALAEILERTRGVDDARLDAGVRDGLLAGLGSEPRLADLGPPDPASFTPFPTVAPASDRRTICFVTSTYPPLPAAGVARATETLAQVFSEAGHAVHVVTAADGPPRVTLQDGVWVHRTPLPPRWIPELEDSPLRPHLTHLAAMYAVVDGIDRRTPVDVVAGQLWTADTLLCAYRWPTVVFECTSMRTIAEIDPAMLDQPGVAGQILLEDALLSSPATIHRQWLGVPDRRVARARTGGALEIAFVGRLDRRKGVDVMLEAAVSFLRAHPDAQLRLIGDDPGTTDWPARVPADLAGRVEFRGHVPDGELLQAMADADVVCAPSRFESFGLVPVEAMMQGRPVIGGAAGGMLDTIVDGATGLLVEPGSAPALTAALERLASDAALRERMGAAGRARYEAEFSPERAAARLAEVWRGLAPPAGDPHVGVAGLLERLCALDDGSAPAGELLDPARHPWDPRVDLSLALAEGDGAFVHVLYRSAHGRDPRPDELGAALHRLHTETRRDLLRDLAPGLPVPELDVTEVAAALRHAWLQADDAGFRRVLESALDVTPPPGPRADAARAVLADPALMRRMLTRLDLGAVALRSPAELAAELCAIPDDGAFVDAVYRELLGREADPGGRAGYLDRLGDGWDRDRVVADVVGSPEGRERGLGDELAGPPSPGRRRFRSPRTRPR